MMEAVRSSETSVLTRDSRRIIPEEEKLRFYRKLSGKSYKRENGWKLTRVDEVTVKIGLSHKMNTVLMWFKVIYRGGFH
jgi:hypothetical protein